MVISPTFLQDHGTGILVFDGDGKFGVWVARLMIALYSCEVQIT